MKKSVELVKLFLNDKTDITLSKKQSTWLFDVLYKEKITPISRWDGKQTFIVVEGNISYIIYKFNGIGRIVVEAIKEPTKTWIVYRDSFGKGSSIKAPKKGEELEEIKWLMQIGVTYVMKDDQEPVEISKLLEEYGE